MTKHEDLSKGVPSSEDLNQSRSYQLNPKTTLGEVEINPNQQRIVGMFKKASDFDHCDEINPFTQMESNPATSARQARFMQGCLHNPGSMSGKCPSKEVAREFSHE